MSLTSSVTQDACLPKSGAAFERIDELWVEIKDRNLRDLDIMAVEVVQAYLATGLDDPGKALGEKLERRAHTVLAS